MKKILIFGVSGLLGNAMYKYLSSNKLFDICGTIHNDTQNFSGKNSFQCLDVLNYDDISKIIDKIRPDWIINCIVDTKNRSGDSANFFFINSIFPQLIQYYSSYHNYRFINFSSNGVFDGDRNRSYRDNDIPDAKDMYGISKILSEKIESLVIRTSIIGHSLNGKSGLLDWFLNTEEKEVFGHAKVYWNGVTTLTLAKVTEKIIQDNAIFGNEVMQITSEKKSKYELLKLFKNIYKNNVTIKEEKRCVENKTLKPSWHQENYFSDLIIPIADQIRELKRFYEK